MGKVEKGKLRARYRHLYGQAGPAGANAGLRLNADAETST
jgi:hypothetical protein